MSRRRQTDDRIIGRLRQGDREPDPGGTVVEACRTPEVTARSAAAGGGSRVSPV